MLDRPDVLREIAVIVGANLRFTMTPKFTVFQRPTGVPKVLQITQKKNRVQIPGPPTAYDVL